MKLIIQIQKLILQTLSLKAQRKFSSNYCFKYLLLGTKQAYSETWGHAMLLPLQREPCSKVLLKDGNYLLELYLETLP